LNFNQKLVIDPVHGRIRVGPSAKVLSHGTKTERTRGGLRTYAPFQATLVTAQVSRC